MTSPPSPQQAMIAAFCDAHVEFACFKPFAAAATDAAGVKSATDCMRSMLAAFPQKAAAFEELMAGIRHDGENAALKAEVAALKARLAAAEKRKAPPVADAIAEEKKAPPAADVAAEKRKSPPASADVAAEEKKAKRPVSSEKRKPPPAADAIAEEKKAPPASADVAAEEKKAKRPVSRKELERFLNAPDTDEDEATTTRRKRDDEGASSTDEEFLPAPAKKQRAPLTQEQRDRKNEKERLRRAALRAQKENE